VREAHVDGFRLDAVHAIVDASPLPFVEEMAASVHEAGERVGRRVIVIAESEANDPSLVRPRDLGGAGLDGQWDDGYHHAVHALLTGERNGYYDDFGTAGHLAKALRQGYVYTGEHSRFRRRRHGRPPEGVTADQFVVFAQNHDQVGNRVLGRRLNVLVDFETAKLATGLALLAPFVPLLFMGEEYGETAPFNFFVSFDDPGLGEAVRRGRREEFSPFNWQGEPPDPQSAETFQACRIDWSRRTAGRHGRMLAYCRALLALRRRGPALGVAGDRRVEESGNGQAVLLWRTSPVGRSLLIANLSETPDRVAVPASGKPWSLLADSADEPFGGPGTAAPARLDGTEVPMAPRSLVIYAQESD
jgi:maltooligosyltrehalose trehalohydrolase